jgi:shikimate kinase
LGINHLFLTGYRGTGKSTVGKVVADRLGLPFLDTDIQIEAATNKSITDIFQQHGELFFRDLESCQFEHLSTLTNSHVVSLGGGAILREQNRTWIKSLGQTVWLKASVDTLVQRIAMDAHTQNRRPKLSQLGERDEIQSILEKRISWYTEVSQFSIDTDGLSADNIAEQVIDWYRHRNGLL